MSAIGAPPAELKPIAPYLARAKELQVADPAISYWCTYYALQQALSLGVKAPESNVFLGELMDRLEAAKGELGSNEAITDDAAASAYVENFAVKLFAQADDEDRAGKSTRLTAKKFLAAANFHEILSTFGELSTENRDKIKYSKWKASDIAKALREGRQPTPGPAGGLPESTTDDLPPTANEVTSDEAKELAKELASVGTTDESQTAVVSDVDADPAKSTRSATATATDDDCEPESYPFPQHPTTPLPSAPPLESFEKAVTPPVPEPTAPSAFLETLSQQVQSVVDLGPTTPLVPPSHQTSTLPPPLPRPPAPLATGSSSGFASAVFAPAPPSQPQPPPEPIAVVSSHAPIVNGSTPDMLDPMVITRIQKHAKWAISALNYDDLETARKELRLALGMLGG